MKRTVFITVFILLINLKCKAQVPKLPCNAIETIFKDTFAFNNCCFLPKKYRDSTLTIYDYKKEIDCGEGKITDKIYIKRDANETVDRKIIIKKYTISKKDITIEFNFQYGTKETGKLYYKLKKKRKTFVIKKHSAGYSYGPC